MKMRRCTRCARPLARTARADARYCSDTCRSVHWHRKVRLARALARQCEVCRKRIIIGKRLDSRYCSPTCRQRGYRQRKVVLGKPQRTSKLGGDLDIATAAVQPITLAAAKAIIEQHEPMPAVSRYAFGI